jgi:putative endonuclease
VTSNLTQRLDQHKSNAVESFTKQYKVHNLVYYEECIDAQQAIWREKNLKSWKREWKLALIEKDNPNWNDLSVDL